MTPNGSCLSGGISRMSVRAGARVRPASGENENPCLIETEPDPFEWPALDVDRPFRPRLSALLR